MHRDVAPSNVLISELGAVKLGDFGQARRCAPQPAAQQGRQENGPVAADCLTHIVGTRW